MPWFRAFLDDAISDVRLSRSERSKLGQLLGDHQPRGEKLALYRSQLFDLVESRLDDAVAADARLRFCEDVVRVLAGFQDGRASTAPKSEALFFPSDKSHRRLLELLADARESIDVCVFTITDDRVVSKLESAVGRGCRVRVISDDDKSEDRGSDVNRLHRFGALVKVDHDPEHMHHKFALIDGETLLTGSYNWTRSAANRNRENILITDDPHAFSSFQQEFDRLWERFERP